MSLSVNPNYHAAAHMKNNKESLRQVPNIENQSCFGCGEENPIGLRMKFSTDGQKMYSEVAVPLTMVGWDNTVHGGILSTIVDEIMGWTVIHLIKKIGVTRSITVNFLQPVRGGDRLIVVGTVLESNSQRSASISGEIYNNNGVKCVQATGEFSTMKPETAVRLGVSSKEYMMQFQKILR
jgi:uncharacterized protein (TIGR00369 family)